MELFLIEKINETISF